MAPQARVEHLRGRHFGKGPNGLFLAELLNVCLSRSVTTLATGPLGWLFAADDALVMRVLKKGLPLRRMALLANLPSDIPVVGALLSVDGRARELKSKDPKPVLHFPHYRLKPAKQVLKEGSGGKS